MSTPPDNTPVEAARPTPAELEAIQIVRRLREAGHVSYFAGGCVRDRLLGLPPSDFDVATDAPPSRVRELFPNSRSVGQAFGVMLVRQGRSTIEVATFRTEEGYSDGRRPDAVHFATAEKDAARRDFTINGLFYDPIDHRVIDYVGGVEDLRAGVLRAIGRPEQRFAEDHLRLLRAVRFAARFGLRIESATDGAIVRHAAALAKISRERIADELQRMLTPVTRGDAYRLLCRYGLLDIVLEIAPGISPTEDQPDERPVVDVSHSVFLHLSPGHPISFPLALLVAMIDSRTRHKKVSTETHPAKDTTREAEALIIDGIDRLVSTAKTALKLSNDDLSAMKDIGQWINRLAEVEPPRVAIIKRFLARPHVGDATDLLRAHAAAGRHSRRITDLLKHLAAYEGTEVAPPPLLTGDVLVTEGFAPGRSFKRVLEMIYDAQLEESITTSGAALAMAKNLMSQKTPTESSK